MKEAIGQVLSLGIGVAVSPIPIIAVVLMLATPRARSNGPAFVLGWVVGLAIVGTVVLLVSGGADASSDGEPATWVSVLELVLGLLLLLYAVRGWRGRPRRGDHEAALPTWMQTIDAFSAPKALAMGVLLSGVNPKNLHPDGRRGGRDRPDRHRRRRAGDRARGLHPDRHGQRRRAGRRLLRPRRPARARSSTG